MKKITIRCHACKARIKAPAELLGKRRHCPRCKQVILVRLTPPTDASILLVRDQQDEDTRVLPGLHR